MKEYLTREKKYYDFITSPDALEKVVKNVRLATSQYVEKYHLKSLVLGISGGIDSAFCAALCKPVCDCLSIPLVGRSMTIETNTTEEIERSIMVGETFCHDFEYMDLTDIFLYNKKILGKLDGSDLSKRRQGNMKARTRMMVLYDLAQLHGGLVVSTDNLTEFLTGFWTLHGDVGDFAPIINLWKTEVYDIAKYLLSECSAKQRQALEACIAATPVDGLGISKSDCEQLGVSNYGMADQYLWKYIFNDEKDLEKETVIQKHLNSMYKRENPFVISRETLLF
ncbi:MAG: NAD(+) synthase [Bacteroidales bacterium]|nr:NAD(+) synthase [Bacteroidales bacterium]